MITQCPSCRTHFRVRARQLAARAGQVRCGKCNRVFDALEHLTEEIAPAREPIATHEASTALEPPVGRAASAAHEPSDALEASVANEASVAREDSPAPALWATHEPPAAHESSAAREPSLAHEYAAAPAVAATAESAPEAAAIAPEVYARRTVTDADARAEITDAAAALFGTLTPEPAAARPASVETWPASGADAFDFGPSAAVDPVRQARRWPWLLGALLLLLVLLAQAAYYYRSAIMVLFPETKPYAAALCATLGCDLPLPRRIELMSIEASDLQADTTNPKIMVLSATLKNRAIFAQQHPMLELTLTDAQDQPVVRRVLAPQDYVGKVADVKTGFAAVSEIAIKVFIEGSQIKATGYRLYLFYP